MGFDDPAREWQRLSELYRRMSEEQLLNLADQQSDLTSTAKQVLQQEFSRRGLQVPEVEKQKDHSFAGNNCNPDINSPYAEDRQLVDIATVFSRRDAFQLKGILDSAEIPFSFGTEQATRIESITSHFNDGVPVQTMRVAAPMARAAMKAFEPADEPDLELDAEYAHTQCPRCHSEDVVFGESSEDGKPSEQITDKFQWTCESCGYKWEDDGVVEPVRR